MERSTARWFATRSNIHLIACRKNRPVGLYALNTRQRTFTAGFAGARISSSRWTKKTLLSRLPVRRVADVTVIRQVGEDLPSQFDGVARRARLFVNDFAVGANQQCIGHRPTPLFIK